MSAKYLTKSLFVKAMECPTKLYYQAREEYANQSMEDPFLAALAEGGFQVGELSRAYHPKGIYVRDRSYDEALDRTKELLKKESITLFEAAAQFENFFVRTDILIKDGNSIKLVEVKAKTFDKNKQSEFMTKSGEISSAWKPYMLDVAFQKHILNLAYPKFNISAYLMLVDKDSICPTDGLNQIFRIVRDDLGKKRVIAKRKLTSEELSMPLMYKVNVDKCCDEIFADNYGVDGLSDFDSYIKILAESYVSGKKINPIPSKQCGDCEFYCNEKEEELGLKSGFKECWKEYFDWQDEDFEEPTVLEVWNCRKKNLFLEEKRAKIRDISEEDIKPIPDGKPGLSTSQRQWLQISKIKGGDSSAWIDRENLKTHMESWTYPLHFIDFETAMAAIPFNKGRHPYEGIAFQYSHHIVYEDGNIVHKGQYLNTEPGFFPNYDFIRSFKKELEGDRGSIFRYAAHENTYLNLIYRQLQQEKSPVADREELMDFILSISQSTSKSKEKWLGERNMIDLMELVKRFYYSPLMKGSNSIKQVLLAMLSSSPYLQNKYSKPIYGAKGGIPSLNYRDWTWVQFENGKTIDPYRLLPKMFEDIGDKEHFLLSESDELKDGGAALTAYVRMQYEDMQDFERAEIEKALLKYCELDTLAMVMIYEGWKEEIWAAG